MDVYLLSLFTSDLLLGFAGALNLKWVHDGKSYSGHFCNAQAVILHASPALTALSTLAITIHTFVVVWWNRGMHSLFTAKLVVFGIWLVVTLFIAVSFGTELHKSNFFVIPSLFGCTLRKEYSLYGIAGVDVLMWLTFAVSLLLYFPLFFWSRGNITIHPDVWWKFRVHRQLKQDGEVDTGTHRRRALRMIAYPVAYCAAIIPISIAAFPPKPATHKAAVNLRAFVFVAYTIVYLIGAFDVLLFALTRPNLLLFGKKKVTEVQLEILFMTSNYLGDE